MLALNNPAARLVHCLRRLGAVDGATPGRRAWAEALAVDPDDLPRLLERLGALCQLPPEVRRQIERQPDLDHEIYLRWFPRVEKALAELNLAGPIAAGLSHLDESAFYGLEFCAEYLGRQAPEPAVPEAELEALGTAVEELLGDIASSTVEPAAKRYLLAQLDALRAAIQNHDLLGAAPLRAAVNAALGSLLTEPHRRADTTRTKLGERFWKLIARAAFLLATDDARPQLPAPVRQLLPATFTTTHRRKPRAR